MADPINFFTSRFCVTKIVLPAAIGFSLVIFSLSHKPRQEKVLDLTGQTHFCELHGAKLHPDFVPLDCVNEDAEFPNKTYPRAWQCQPGCLSHGDQLAKVQYCEKCRSSMRWRRFTRNIKTTWQQLFSL